MGVITSQIPLHRGCNTICFTSIFGCLDWVRTNDKRINSPLLYQLSYKAIFLWCGMMDSNHRVLSDPDLQSVAINHSANPTFTTQLLNYLVRPRGARSVNLAPYRHGYTRAALDAFDNLLSSAPFNSSLTKLSISFVNHFLSLSISLTLHIITFYYMVLKTGIEPMISCL